MASNWFLALGRRDNLHPFSIWLHIVRPPDTKYVIGMPLGIQEESYERHILGLPFYCAFSRAHLLEEALKCFFCASSLCDHLHGTKKKEDIVHL